MDTEGLVEVSGIVVGHDVGGAVCASIGQRTWKLRECTAISLQTRHVATFISVNRFEVQDRISDRQGTNNQPRGDI